MAAVMTLSEVESRVWDRILDSDASNRVLATATLDRLINRAYTILKGIRDDRVVDVTSATSGFVANVGDTQTSIGNTVPIRHILNIYPEFAGAKQGGEELQRYATWQINRARGEFPAQGIPRAVTLWRLGTATAADVGKWAAMLWPVPDNTYSYLLSCIVDPTPLASSTDKLDVDPETCWAICDMAAAIGARLIGLDDAFIAEIKQDVPAQFRATMGTMESEYFGKNGPSTGDQ